MNGNECTLSAREGLSRLIAEGWNRDDAVDALADAGFDPTGPQAAWILMTEERFLVAVASHQIRYADVVPLNGKRGPGRPRIGKRVEITLSGDDIAWLDQKGAELEVSRSEMIRRLIEWWREKGL